MATQQGIINNLQRELLKLNETNDHRKLKIEAHIENIYQGAKIKEKHIEVEILTKRKQ